VTATEVFAMAEALAERIMVRALEAGEADRQATREMNERVEKALKDELDKTRAELEIANRELEEMKIRARWWRVPR
jgi:multidrug resistance efflux pump